MLKLKSIWHGSIFLIAFTMVVSGGVLQLLQNDFAIAQNGTSAPVCDANSTFISLQDGSTVNGLVVLDFYGSPTTSGAVANFGRVEFFTDHNFIAKVISPTSYSWTAEWDTSLYNNGPVMLSAHIFDNQNHLLCTTVPISVTIKNPTPTTTNPVPPVTATNRLFKLKRANPLTNSWTGVTNIPKIFSVNAFYNDGSTTTLVNNQTQFDWHLEPNGIGQLRAPFNNPEVGFFSGPQAGTTRLVLNANFAGFSDTLIYDIVIDSAVSSTYPIATDPSVAPVDSTGSTSASTTTTTSGSGGSNTTVDSSTSTTATTTTKTKTGSSNPDTPGNTTGTSSPPKLSTNDPKLTQCMVETVGQDTYNSLKSSDKRLNFKQLKLAKRCFAEQRYVLPANVVPIDPLKIETVKEDNLVAKVNDVSQVQSPLLDKGGSDKGILLNGRSLPNTTIVLYIFSEPLVLTTTTDDQGNWSYVLEDPLVAGDHEVYVAVEDQDGEQTRSSAFKFSVAESASIDTNPSGLSLVLNLSGSESNTTIYYVSAVASIILIGSGIFIFLIRRKTEPPEIDNTSHNSLYS